jgi:putative transposase
MSFGVRWADGAGLPWVAYPAAFQVRATRQEMDKQRKMLTFLCQKLPMSRYLRPRIPAATIFFTLALERRGQTLLVDEVERLRIAVRQTMAERPFRIDAWVVLPDHLHAIWTLPEDDSDYAVRWRLIKARFSMGLPPGYRRASHALRQERAIWQRRFWEHHIRDDADLDEHLRYCWHNPVRHGLCSSPHDWPYSSVHRDVPQTGRGACKHGTLQVGHVM